MFGLAGDHNITKVDVQTLLQIGDPYHQSKTQSSECSLAILDAAFVP
jgi:hypothetical protein